MGIIDAIIKYYQYLGYTETSYDGKKKLKLILSGRPNIKGIITFFLIGLIALLFVVFNKETSDITITLCVILFIMTIISISLKSYLIFRKLEGKPININIYERDLPSKLKPAHVRMLLNDGLIDEVSLYGTLMDLIDRGYIEIISGNIEKEGLCDYQQNELILRKTDKNTDELLKYEIFTIDWLIHKYSLQDEISSKKIHDSLTSNSYSEQPYEIFREWQGLVMLSFPFNKFYKNTNITKRFTYLIMMLIGLFMFSSAIGVFTFLYALGNFMYAAPLCALTEAGVDEKDRWNDLKKYLQDFSLIQDKTIEMVKVWNFYLTYAIIFEMGNESKEQIEEFIGNNIYTMYEPVWNNREELRIIELRSKPMTKEEIEKRINDEFVKYELDE